MTFLEINLQSINQKKDGTRLTNTKDCLCSWKYHFNDLLNKPCDAADAELQRDADQATPNADSHTDPVTSREVELCLKRLKNRRAPGICSITAALLKKGGDSMIKWLAYIINIVWIKKIIPDDWRRGIILPFWKNKGNEEVCSNHRDITLLSIPGKLFAMILLECIRPTFHNHRRLKQAGFTAGRSTTEHIFSIRQIIEKSNEFNRSTYIAFIDFKAAFDSVSRDFLWKILQIYGVPQELSVLVRQLYTYTRRAVRLASSLSEEFTIETGVTQGCVIAPDLFNCVIDHIMRRLLSRCSLGIQLGDYQLTDLDYADDIAIIASSACVLQEALMILQEETNLVGMQISWPKTKLMAITPNPTSHLPLKICNTEVLFVDSFTYLGSLITNDGSSSHDLTSRIAKAASAIYRLSKTCIVPWLSPFCSMALNHGPPPSPIAGA